MDGQWEARGTGSERSMKGSERPVEVQRMVAKGQRKASERSAEGRGKASERSRKGGGAPRGLRSPPRGTKTARERSAPSRRPRRRWKSTRQRHGLRHERGECARANTDTNAVGASAERRQCVGQAAEIQGGGSVSPRPAAVAVAPDGVGEARARFARAAVVARRQRPAGRGRGALGRRGGRLPAAGRARLAAELQLYEILVGQGPQLGRAQQQLRCA